MHSLSKSLLTYIRPYGMYTCVMGERSYCYIIREDGHIDVDTWGGGGGKTVTYMIGQRSSYCRRWFELYQPILI